jgi:hypothetical protein
VVLVVSRWSRSEARRQRCTYKELAIIKRMLSPVAGLGTFLVSCTEAAERAIEVRLKTNEAIRKARRSLPGIGGMPIIVQIDVESLERRKV